MRKNNANKIYLVLQTTSILDILNFFSKNYELIQLSNLEFGQWCSFSPNEKSLGIFGS